METLINKLLQKDEEKQNEIEALKSKIEQMETQTQ